MTTLLENHVAATWSVLHPFSTEDQAAMLPCESLSNQTRGSSRERRPEPRSTPSWSASQLPLTSYTKLTTLVVFQDGGAALQMPDLAGLSYIFTAGGSTGALPAPFAIWRAISQLGLAWLRSS
jgi:hypothetical protein